jgi:mannosyltransferase OCH1-like enzyme
MTSWSRNQINKNIVNPMIDIISTVESDIISFDYSIRDTIYHINDISVIFHRIDEYTLQINTITVDDKFVPYTLVINNGGIPTKHKIPERNYRIRFRCNRNTIKNNINPIIPKVVIQTWETKDIDNTPIGYPKKVIKEMNPEYEYVLFDCDERREFIKNNFDEKVLNAYDKLKPKAYQVDLWRYCYLYKNGGLYIDIKTHPIRPFYTLIDNNCELLIMIEQEGRGIFNGVMGAPPNHPWIKLIIDTCVERVENNFYGETSLDITGPNLCSYCFNVYNNKKTDEYIVETNNRNHRYLHLMYDQLIDINTDKLKYFHRIFSSYYNIYNKLDKNYYKTLWDERDVYN